MKCVVCGCSYERPCGGGCGWVSLKILVALNCDGPLCTTCADAVSGLVEYADEVYRFRAAPLMRAVKKAYAHEALLTRKVGAH